MLGYKVPVLTSARAGEVEEWEVYALDVLAATLDGDDSSRLSRELVRGREIAVQAGAGYDSTARLPTLFSFSAVPRPGVTLEELEAVLRAEIDKLIEAPPSDAELERIKTQVVADMLYQRDSLFFQGMLIGSLEAIGLDWRIRDEYADRIRAVTPEQVQAVARKYLVESGATVTYLLPAEDET
jgi:zinc protease